MFYTDKRFIYMVLIILIIMNLMSMNQVEWMGLILTLPGVLLAITFHEYAHAYAATKLGDTTPRSQNRLNLNPTSHIDPIGFVLLLFVGFGWGKPVEINPRNFTRRYSQTAGEAIVAAAGPIMNFALAIVLTLICCLFYKFLPGVVATKVGGTIFAMLQYAMIMNVGLGVFNLIPLPPLDGSKILVNFLPFRGRQWVFEHEQVFYIIFLVIWLTGIAGYIISPILNFIAGGIMHIGLWMFGLL